nr:MAG TPA: homing endonuclease [Caudoviricetes sp.]
MEIWKPIKGYEGKYEVSTHGRVRSLIGSGGESRICVLKPFIAKTLSINYARVGLSKHQQNKTKFIHRLVAETFIPNPENKPFVNHIDNNPLNNSVSNLEWCTQKENIQHSLKQGRRPQNTQQVMQQFAEDKKAETEQKYKTLLGHCFVAYHLKGNKPRGFITCRCSECNSEFTLRIDIFSKRQKLNPNQITYCTHCYKSYLTTKQWENYHTEDKEI